MAHFPINHPLQPLYRVLAGLAGVYVLVFGITGLVQTRQLGTFAQDGLPAVLGLHANRAFAIISVVAGVVLVAGAVIGGKLDQRINLVIAVVFVLSGFAMMILLQSSLNFLGFSIATCVVSFLIGMLLFTAALYGKVGTDEEVRAEELFRHGQGPDPDPSHKLTAPNPPHGHETIA